MRPDVERFDLRGCAPVARVGASTALAVDLALDGKQGIDAGDRLDGDRRLGAGRMVEELA